MFQVHADYSSAIYDHSSKTIQSKGCAITAITMAGDYATGQQLDPGAVNETMTNNPADFDGSNVNWGPAVKDVFGNGMEWNSSKKLNSSADPDAADAYLTGVLQLGYPVIVGVKIGPHGSPGAQTVGPGHYVVVTGKQGDTFLINDPEGKRTTLDQYVGGYQTRGYIAPKSQTHSAQIAGRTSAAAGTIDSSALYIAVPDNVEIQVIDPSGRISGSDFAAGTVVEGIPHSSSFTDAIDDVVTGELDTAPTHFVYIDQPAAGSYQINVRGVTDGPYTVLTSMVTASGVLQAAQTSSGVASAGTISSLAVPVVSTILPTVTITTNTPSIDLGTGAAGVFKVTLSAPQSHDVVVHYLVKGSATNGTDYVLLSGAKKIKAGKTSKKINVVPLGDLGGAAKKVVQIRLAEDAGYTIGTPGKVKLKIRGF